MGTPNQISFDGDKRPDEPNDTEPLIELKEAKFNYPTKPDVPILKGISIDVCKN